MPRGYADFGLNPGNVGQFSGDTAELAVRLGATDIIERRGHVLWFDDMSRGIIEYQRDFGVAGAMDQVYDYGFETGICYRMTPNIVGNDDISMRVSAPLLTLSKIGFEFMFRPHKDGADVATVIELGLEVYHGTTFFRYKFRIDPNTGIFSLYAAPGGGGVLTALFTSPYRVYAPYQDRGFNYFKFVVDPTQNKFDRLLYNTFGMGLTQYGGCTNASVSRARVEAEILLKENNSQIPLDWCYPIITIDEP